MDMMHFRGTGTALVTPFCPDGVDYDALGRLVDMQVEGGVDFLVVLGTTGESPTVSTEERRRIVGYVKERLGGRMPMVVGAGSNDTARAVESCREARRLGADGALVVTPYYNKPTQEGLYRHYEAIAENAGLPVIAYNVPGRTGVNMQAATVLRIASLPGIVALKEAAGDMAQADEIIRGLRRVRPDFLVLSGNDDQTYHMLCSGGHGVISVLSNIAPRQVSDMVSAGLSGDLAAAREGHMKLLRLARNLFMETSPAPVKYALSRMGCCCSRLRLPLVEASEACRRQIDADMRDLGLDAPSGAPEKAEVSA